MDYIKSFNEMYEDKFDYDKIIRVLRKTHGWGMGVLTSVDSFESNEEYFLNPENDEEYISQFHIYLTDMQSGRLRGEFHKSSNSIYSRPPNQLPNNL